ncbi:AraC family transcriptional regulator [Novosphingobium album (ex Liu et al. 2023)]|uniref:AraC family transcriptional regulator ligand-binding domain-containing protein n=1 Tax=Novosphingobium album (ex Liu et al. 2023) TaxID=3031130 RepID=A0ABT5WS87_9SPHN|nr:AraC family transcriptional regulator [Novosphingobium album (ex Liu et al. 2023)]MDE8652900.1 AraC family transcriptional regulator ligand-binding domain-containing protein [Novosphingobium album (ex Liu et al. 2023)]
MTMPGPSPAPPAPTLPASPLPAPAIRDEDFERVHARLLKFLPELVADLGGDPAALRGNPVDADDAGPSRAEPELTYRQAIRLMERAAHALDCPDLGMRLAVRQGGAGVFGPLGEVMRHSRSLGDALGYVSRHSYAHSLAARVWLHPLPEEKLVFAGHDILLDHLAHRAQTMEQILLLGHLAAIELTQGHARARRIHFRHQPVSPPRVYRRYFGCEVRFGEPADGVVFSAADLACPIVHGDSRALRRVTAYIADRFTRQHPPFHAEVRGIVMRRLGQNACTNADVARALNLHVRTLHRRLAREGTSFQQVKDEVRRDVMQYYLQQTDLDLARISERLGFAEQSIMTRSCNRWFGRSPTQLRRAAAAVE